MRENVTGAGSAVSRAVAVTSRGWPRHAVALAGFTLLAVVLSWPLVLHIPDGVPGGGASDNVTFLWNFGWVRHALANPGSGLLHTDLLFYPWGTSLVLHTHTLFPALLGATLLARLPIIAAENVTVLAALTLNGFAAYLLAWFSTRRWIPSVLAGLFFAASPYFPGHLTGHFNLLAAWPLPLFAALWLHAVRARSVLVAAAAGGVLALTAYNDYYYLVYELVFLALALIDNWYRVGVTSRRSAAPGRVVDRALLLVGAVLALAALAIAVTGGGVFTVGTLRVSARGGLNVRAAACLCLAAWAWRRWRPWLTVVARPERSPWRDAALLAAAAAVFVVGALPLGLAGWHLWTSGEYVSQHYLWRSVPEGVDPGALVLGSPFHIVWGTWVSRLYDAMVANRVESVAWPGVVGFGAMAAWWRWWRSGVEDDTARFWAWTAAVFFVWALGPWLAVFGVQMGVPLPAILLRYVPIVANARIPGRAMVMVYLALSVLLARAFVRWRFARPGVAAALVGVVILADFLPTPLALGTLEVPRVYRTLADLPHGPVLELPLGVRDGFGERGWLDHQTLFYQASHGNPIVGGFVARLSPSIGDAYDRSPFLNAVLALSAQPTPDEESAHLATTAATAADFLTTTGIRYVVVHESGVPRALVEQVKEWPVTSIAAEDGWELYAVDPRAPGFVPARRSD